MDAPTGPARPLPPLRPVRERCCDCGGSGVTSLGETCPSCLGYGHTHPF